MNQERQHGLQFVVSLTSGMSKVNIEIDKQTIGVFDFNLLYLAESPQLRSVQSHDL